MSAPRRSARIAAMNAPSTPVKTTPKREIPSAPKKDTTRTSRPSVVPSSAPKSIESPELVAAHEAAAALYPRDSEEYYAELEKSPAIHAARASWYERLPFSISGGW